MKLKTWILIGVLLLIFDLFYFYKVGYKLSINSEYIKVYNVQGGYRSWTMLYSHGCTIKNNRMVNLWKWPSFHHVDVRRLEK